MIPDERTADGRRRAGDRRQSHGTRTPTPRKGSDAQPLRRRPADRPAYSAAPRYSVTGGQEQIRLRSPATLSMRDTGGQYFAAAVSPAG